MESVPGSQRRVWKCIGCGREMLQDAGEQADEDRLEEHIRRYQLQSVQRRMP
jgi:hypothetical protein